MESPYLIPNLETQSLRTTDAEHANGMAVIAPTNEVGIRRAGERGAFPGGAPLLTSMGV